MKTNAMVIVFLLLAGSVLGGSYRDKHGNQGSITLGSPVAGTGGSGIDYTVPYTLVDSEGNKSGEYTITSQMLPGRDPGSDDFVLCLLVRDAASQNAAELVFRNNSNVAPLAPILRLLDCSTDPCTEVKTYDDPKWGCWVIQDASDIANYPIELLDTRVITQLLEPAQLSLLPNSTDGTGNWAEIMENHRTNFEEARFRADIDELGEPQSDLLTSRMIDEIESELGTPDDWLVRHFPSIQHSALTFLTGHRALIEDMTTVLFTNYTWPLDFTFPFGRMPIWLVDPHLDAEPSDYHVLATHWERVISGQAALGEPGCWHDYPLDGYTPTLLNGATNLGQYECAEVVTANGFVDRPCVQESDYSSPGTGGTSLRSDVEGAWHNPIHGFIGGSFGPPQTTAGTMVFWVFHTYASTNVLSNWRHAQKREIGTANRTPSCDANGPYLAECQGPTTDVLLDGSSSSDPDGDALNYLWTTDCPGAVLDDATSATPTLTVDSEGCPPECEVMLTVSDPNGASATCSTNVTIEDTTPPSISLSSTTTVLWSPNHNLTDIGLDVTVTDVCDPDAASSLVIEVWSDETEVPEKGDGTGQFAPDAKDLDSGLRLRNERRGRADGRVYLIVATATDCAGNSTTACGTVVCPRSQSGAALLDVTSQAAAAEAACNATGAPPADFHQHGVSGELGDKQ